MSLIARGFISEGMRNSGIDNRGMEANERLEPGAVDIRDLESRLREAGCSRSEAKMYVARYKIIESMTDDQLRDASGYENVDCQRDAELNTEPDAFSELMDRYDKFEIQ